MLIIGVSKRLLTYDFGAGIRMIGVMINTRLLSLSVWSTGVNDQRPLDFKFETA